MLDLLLGEAHQCPQPGLVAVDVPGGVGQDHGDDVFLDEGEDVAVAVAADLVQQALLIAVEAADAGDAGDALGKEGLGEVEVAPLETVLDGPGVVNRPVQAAGIAVVVGEHRGPPAGDFGLVRRSRRCRWAHIRSHYRFRLLTADGGGSVGAHLVGGDGRHRGDSARGRGPGAHRPASDERPDRRGAVHLRAHGGQPRGRVATEAASAGPARPGAAGGCCRMPGRGALPVPVTPFIGRVAEHAALEATARRAPPRHRGRPGRDRQDPVGHQRRRRPGRGAPRRRMVRRSRAGDGSCRGGRGRGGGGGCTRATGGLAGGGCGRLAAVPRRATGAGQLRASARRGVCLCRADIVTVRGHRAGNKPGPPDAPLRTYYTVPGLSVDGDGDAVALFLTRAVEAPARYCRTPRRVGASVKPWTAWHWRSNWPPPATRPWAWTGWKPGCTSGWPIVILYSCHL